MRAHRPASTTSKPSPTNPAWPASTIGTPPAATHSRDSGHPPPPPRGTPARRRPTPHHTPLNSYDLGCGPAGHGALFAQAGHRVAGIDRSTGMPAIAAEALPGHVMRADLRSLPMAGETQI